MSSVIEQPKQVVYQDYSKERRAEVIALVNANGGNVLQTSRDTGIHHATIQYWIANPEKFAGIQQRKSEDLAQRFENAANFYLDLAWDKAAEAPFNHLMTGAGIAIDKMQLLRGNPTSITENVERQELVCILQSALSAGLEGDVIDVTPGTDYG